jgi:malonyl-CoA O-methyltransferase
VTSVLSPAQGYALWAPTYGETAVTVLEAAAVESLGLPLAGRRVLDVGCGVARRLATARDAGASVALGVDLTPAMLARAEGGPLLSAADVRALPVAGGAFDVVWCRLVLGYVADLDAAYAELARSCAPAGVLLVTDFHPAAAAAGHRRTFRDAVGVVHELEHHVHQIDAHRTAAARAGLSLREQRDCVVGDAVRGFYERADRLDMYERQLGLPLVFALVFDRAR